MDFYFTIIFVTTLIWETKLYFTTERSALQKLNVATYDLEGLYAA